MRWLTRLWKKGKNKILHVRLGHIGESHSKRISTRVDKYWWRSSEDFFLCGKYWSQDHKKFSLEIHVRGKIQSWKEYIWDLWGPFPEFHFKKIDLCGLQQTGPQVDWGHSFVITKPRFFDQFKTPKKNLKAESKCQLQALHINRGRELPNNTIIERCKSLQINLEPTYSGDISQRQMLYHLMLAYQDHIGIRHVIYNILER